MGMGLLSWVSVYVSYVTDVFERGVERKLRAGAELWGRKISLKCARLLSDSLNCTPVRTSV